MLLAATAAVLAAAAPYEWPLREAPALTSTFGEYRANHFHGGIDLTTGGRVGIPVVAVADGHVERVRASGAGYGRAIYVRLDDGRTAVYAHLSRFSPAIGAYVEAAQDSLSQYEVDLYPAPGRLPVSRGEVIGASGESGAGAPHFHFELRQGDEGLNPLVHGLSVRDTIAPTIVAVELVPLDGGARADGSFERTAAWPFSARRATKQGPVPVRGRIGVAVRARDNAPGRPNPLAVFSGELILDGAPTYACRFDSASWLRTHEVEITYDPARVREGRRDVLRLWRAQGARARIHDGDGVLDFDRLGKGVHRVEVIVSDASGNRASRSFDVIAGRPPRLLDAGAEPSGSGVRVHARAVDPDGAAVTVTASWRATGATQARALGALAASDGDRFDGEFATPGQGTLLLEARDEDGLAAGPFTLVAAAPGDGECALEVETEFHGRAIEARITSGEPLAAPPKVSLLGPAGPRRLEVEAAGAGYRAFVTPRAGEVEEARIVASGVTASGCRASGSARLGVAGVPVDASGKVVFGGGYFEYEPGSFFGDGLVTIEVIRTVPPSNGLVPVCEAYRFTSADGVLDAGVLLAFALEPGRADRVGLFRRDASSWSFAGSSYDSSRGAVTARVRKLADYALFRDDAAPIIYNPRPAPEALVGERSRLSASVREAGSGVTAAGLSIVLDGRRVVAEYDPEAGTLTAHLRGPLSPGAHEVRFEASDRLGNRAAKQVRFTVGGAEGKRRR